MASPASRSDLKDYCLRRLGFPVVDINVDEDQLEDRIDDALQVFREYHYDGTEDTYLAHQVTSGDISNNYIQLSDNIIGVQRVFPVSAGSVSSTNPQGFNIFDINYQIRLNDFYNLTSSSYTYYVIAKSHLAMLDMVVTGEMPITYNKKVNQLKILASWSGRFVEGSYMVIHCSRVVDPASYSKVYNDLWMKNYCTALFREQWGMNLTKYGNYVLPGGIVIQGDKILSEALVEKEKLLAELRDTYEAPPQMLVG